MRSDMIPGAIFPDYELSDHTAKRRKLSELLDPTTVRARPDAILLRYKRQPVNGEAGATERSFVVIHGSSRPKLWLLMQNLGG